MAWFLRAYPKVELRLWNGTSRRVHDELVDGRVDLGLIVNPGKHPDTVVTPLFEDTVELFHCFPPARVADPTAALSSIPLIYVPELLQSQDLLRQLARRRVTPARLLPCSSLELVKSLVLDRVGIGILPRRVAEHRTARKLRSVSPPLPHFRDRIALVRRYDVPRTAAIRAVIDSLLARARV
jgi:DNA-binding transcriptional LysR family regulator